VSLLRAPLRNVPSIKPSVACNGECPTGEATKSDDDFADVVLLALGEPTERDQSLDRAAAQFERDDRFAQLAPFEVTTHALSTRRKRPWHGGRKQRFGHRSVPAVVAQGNPHRLAISESVSSRITALKGPLAVSDQG